MAVSQIASSSAGTDTAGVFTLAPAVPVGTAAGDLIIAVISAAPTDVTPILDDVTAPTGFASLGWAGPGTFGGFWRHFVTGTPPATFTFTVDPSWAPGSGRYWSVVLYTFRDSTGPINSISAPTTRTVGAAEPYTPVAPTVPAAVPYAILVMNADTGGGRSFISSPPGANGYTRALSDPPAGGGTAMFIRNFASGDPAAMPTLATSSRSVFASISIGVDPPPPARRPRRGIGLVR